MANKESEIIASVNGVEILPPERLTSIQRAFSNKKTYATIATVGVVGAVAYVAVPLILTALTGIAAIAAVGAITAGSYLLADPIYEKGKNLKLRLALQNEVQKIRIEAEGAEEKRKAVKQAEMNKVKNIREEAAADPFEHLQMELQKQTEQAQLTQKKLTQNKADMKTFEQKMDVHRDFLIKIGLERVLLKRPQPEPNDEQLKELRKQVTAQVSQDKTLISYRAQLENNRKFFEKQLQNLQNTSDSIAEFELMIVTKRSEYDLALSSVALLSMTDQESQKQQMYDNVAKDSALAQIQNKINESLSAIEMALIDSEKADVEKIVANAMSAPLTLAPPAEENKLEVPLTVSEKETVQVG